MFSRKKHAKIGILDVPVETEHLYPNKIPNFVGENPMSSNKQKSNTKKLSPKKNSKQRNPEIMKPWDEYSPKTANKLRNYYFGQHDYDVKNQKIEKHADTIVRAKRLSKIANPHQPGDTKYRASYGGPKGGRRRRKTAKRSRR